MTGAELRAVLDEFELQEPVTMTDLQGIFDEVKPKLAAGSTLDVVKRLRDQRAYVEVIIDERTPSPCRVELSISP